VIGEVEVGDRACAAAGGVERKAAGEAEGIEHVAAGGQRFDAGAVLALVEKEPGFLAMADVGFELQAVFAEDDGFAWRVVGGKEKAFGQAVVALGAFEQVAAEAEDEGVGLGRAWRMSGTMSPRRGSQAAA
jgi:hypothetical protein